MSSESQRSIDDWATSVFGPGIDYFAARKRVVEEMREFETAPDLIEAMQEAADVVIALFRFAAVAEFDLLGAVDNKMYINRQREWIAHGDGTGHHIKEAEK